MKCLRFFVPTWLGCLSGFVFLRAPWGPPTFKWKSFATFWSLLVLAIQHTMIVDFVRQTKFVNSLAFNELTRQLHDFVFIVTAVVFYTVRVVLFVHAKRLANLLNYFYNYPLKREYVRWRFAFIISNFFIMISGILALVCSAIFIVALRSWAKDEENSSFKVLGKVLSGILGALFGHVASVATTNVAFAIITYISLYIGMIYCDFCNEIEEHLELAVSNNKNTLFSKEFFALKQNNSKKNIFVQSTSLCSSEILLNKFEEIKVHIEVGDKIISPLALVLVVSETFRSVNGAHEIIINHLGGWFMVDTYLNLAQQVIHAGILFVGQYVQDKMKERRKRLQKMITLMQETRENNSNNNGLLNLAKYVINFDWKLSGWNFFNIEKKLLSGMLATCMSYIVILVQLQIALQSTSCLSELMRNGFNQTIQQKQG